MPKEEAVRGNKFKVKSNAYKIGRGELSIQIVQGKMRSTVNAFNLTPRISIAGEISTHERLRSRFTV